MWLPSACKVQYGVRASIHPLKYDFTPDHETSACTRDRRDISVDAAACPDIGLVLQLYAEISVDVGFGCESNVVSSVVRDGMGRSE
jgi:hypothetical protein